jgi:trimethylamine--corrinoid protein Co-methyltransferase
MLGPSGLGRQALVGAGHTYQAMERDYHDPKLADREQPKTWADAGALSAWDRAKAKA